MPLRFYRRFRAGPFRLNLNKRGVSTSRSKGAWFTVGQNHVRTSIGVPGRGLFWYSQRRSPRPAKDDAPFLPPLTPVGMDSHYWHLRGDRGDHAGGVLALRVASLCRLDFGCLSWSRSIEAECLLPVMSRLLHVGMRLLHVTSRTSARAFDPIAVSLSGFLSVRSARVEAEAVNLKL